MDSHVPEKFSVATGHRLSLALFALPRIAGVLLIAGAAWATREFPTGNNFLSAALVLYLLLLWREPRAWLVVIPFALPLLDLAYWSGRHFFTAFDILILTTVGWGLLLGRPWLGHMDRGARGFALVLLLIQTWITARGLLPLSTPVPGAWTDYFASTNALREFKGVLSALLLWPMLAGEQGRGTDVQRWLAAGLLAGLLAALTTIVWERGLFTGLFNLSSPYRVSGWFSTMLTGGAAIDAFLALSAPFVGGLFLLWDDRRLRLLGLLLGMAAIYGLYVTYSRANYPAMAAMAAVFATGLWVGRTPGSSTQRRRKVFTLLAATLVMLVILGIAGKNIQARFQSTLADLQVRLDHWSSVIEMLGNSPHGLWLGAGKGSFPREYYWQTQLQGRHLALAQVHQDSSSAFVRFSKSDRGGNLFLQQRLGDVGDAPYRLELTLRAPHGNAESLLIEFCERHILKYRDECLWRKIKIPEGTTEWKEFSTKVSLKGLGVDRFGPFARPVDIAVMNRGIKQGLDIGAVQLLDQQGNTLLYNPGFDHGWDHWFLSYGDHLRWHIKNVFVYWLFEGGGVGLIIMLALSGYLFSRLWRSMVRHDPFAVLAATSLTGCLMIGLFDSLFDEPRIALLFYLLAGAVLICRPTDAALAARAAFSARHLSPEQIRLAFIGAIGAAVILLATYLAAPRLFLSIEIGLLSWIEDNAPSLARRLGTEDDRQARLSINAAVPAWQPRHMRQIPAGQALLNGEPMESLEKAVRSLQPGDHLQIGEGIYRQALIINADDVRVSGHGHVVIERASAKGKGAIITNGDNIVIENIECRHIAVSDRNGACVRHQGTNLTLDHVYFHSSQQGILTGRAPGLVRIHDSRFEHLGMRGRAHAIYVGGGELLITNSLILASKSWGHEIKSRASDTRIERSIVASLGGTDSRLLDIPNGGTLTVINSILQQGPQSSNEGVIGFGLEGKQHRRDAVRLTGNIIILERPGGNVLFQIDDDSPPPDLERNVIISEANPDLDPSNIWFKRREDAGLAPYPMLPAIPQD